MVHPQSGPPVALRTVLDFVHRAREKDSRVFGAFSECLFMACVHPVNIHASSLNSAEVGAKLAPETAPSVPGRQSSAPISGGTLLNHKRDSWAFVCFKESQFPLLSCCLPPACCLMWTLMTKLIIPLGSRSHVICRKVSPSGQS